MIQPTLEESFWAKVAKSDGCWLWTGAKKGRGCGHLKQRSRRSWISAHRLSYEMHVGPIPPGIRVLHRCDVPACVRPDHLFLGTGKDNYEDMRTKGRVYSPGAPGEANGRAKLTNVQVVAIRRQYQSGTSQTVLAHEFGLTLSGIKAVTAGRSWRHIPMPNQEES